MNIKPELNYADETALDDLFVVKRANEWIRASKMRPVPKLLFGECWLEGELAVLTGSAGVGKSLLAVQIGESIARGDAIEPFPLNAKPQSVLYIDLKLSDKQFEMRYARDYEPEDGEFLKGHYRFSDRFHRVEIDVNRRLPDGFASLAEVIPVIIKKLVAQTRAKIVIIDDITSLQTSIYGYRETPPLMRELKRLQRQLGLSILVLASDPGRDVSRSPTTLRLLGRFADNVFTIGVSTGETSYRYIKHIRSQSTDIVYDTTHVATFVIDRFGENFLGFNHITFVDEEALKSLRSEPDLPLIRRIKELSDQGMSIRKIAGEVAESKTKVHRLLQRWEPEMEVEEEIVDPLDADEEEYDDQEEEEDVPFGSYRFPGAEEYEKALDNPRFRRMFSVETPEACALRREYLDIENARDEADNEWKKTGKAPTLAEVLARGKPPADEAAYDEAMRPS
ncbi:hypothetical protein BH10ACI2_BH10ACI2_09720 [soil metagenome]